MTAQSSAREAQRRYRNRQKAKLQDFQTRVDVLQRKLRELDVQQAGLASQNRLLEEQAAAVASRTQQEAAEPAGRDEPVWTPSTSACIAEFANRVRSCSLVVELTPEAACCMPVAELVGLTKDFYTQLGVALNAEMREAERERALSVLISAKVSMRKALESMSMRQALAVTSQLHGCAQAAPAPPSVRVLQQVLGELALSEEQRQELLVARQRLLRKHEEVKQERAKILRRIQDAMESDRLADEQGSARYLLEEMDALEDLKRNLEREHGHTFQFHATIGDTLATVQFARLLVASHERGVRPWCLLQLMAAQEVAAARGPAAAAAHFPDKAEAFLKHAAAAAAAAASPAAEAAGSRGLADSPAGADGSGSSGGGSGGALPAPRPESESGSLELLLGELVDDKLLSLADPLDLDFGQPAGGEQDQLWNLVQSLAT